MPVYGRVRKGRAGVLKLEHFEYMRTVARLGSIRKAAEALYVSQPYLSHCLRELEEELGVRLMERSFQGILLTGPGEEFVRYAEEIQTVLEKVRHLREEEAPPLPRLFVSSIYSFTMLDLFEQFSKYLDYNRISLSYEEIPNVRIPEKVASGQSDIGLVYLLSTTEKKVLREWEEKQLVFRPLCREAICAVVGREHPLAGRSELKPEELREYPLLIESIKSGVGAEGLVENNLFPHLFAENEKMPIRFDNNRSLMYYLTKSDRCFTVGQKCLNRSNPFLISRELFYIPIKEESAYTTTGVLFRREARLSEEAQAWIGFLEQNFLPGIEPAMVSSVISCNPAKRFDLQNERKL